jgi:pimeloyl-ACP methyl ester carboxylesterase
MNVTVNGINLFFRDEGAGPTLVLLHAFPLSGEMWRPQIDALRGQARLIVPDLRGFGQTDAPMGVSAPSLDTMASDVIALLDHLEIEQFVLGGLSMGGYLSFALLRQLDRNRVRGLILADTKAVADTEEARNNRQSMAVQALHDGPDPIAEAMVGKLLGTTSLESRPELGEQVKSLIRANTGAGIAAAQYAMAARPDSTPMLGDLAMPTLVIVGEEDGLTPPAEAEKMASTLPNAQLQVMPKAGHLSNWEQSEAFNTAISGFLERL